MERIAHGIGGRQAFLPARAQVLAEKMHRIVHHDPQRHSGYHRQGQADLSHQQAPEAERHTRRHQVGNNADQADTQGAQCKNQDKRDEHQCQRRPGEHAADIARAYMREHQRGAGAMHLHGSRCIFSQPVLRPFLQRYGLVA